VYTTSKETGTGSRGFNIVAVEPRTHNILIKRAYDTSTSKIASRRLARDLNSLASGTIVMAAVKEDGVGMLTEGVYQYFVNQGSTDLVNLAQGEMYVFIGVKDQ
jgi:hypothetical protein